MRTIFTLFSRNQGMLIALLLSSLILIGIPSGASAQGQIKRPTSASGNHVTNPGRAINGVSGQFAELEANSGIAGGLFSYKGELELTYDHVVPAGTTTFIEVREDENLFDQLLGGSLGEILADALGFGLFGAVSMEVEVFNGTNRFINRSSLDDFDDDEIRVITGANNKVYLAITPSQAYTEIHINNVASSLLGLGSTFDLEVHDVFYYSDIQTCGGPIGTSYDVSGVSLDLLKLGGSLADDLGNSIDGDLDTYSILSGGILSLAATTHQHFYFPAAGRESDELKFTLSASGQLLQLDLLGDIRVLLYHEGAEVANRTLSSLNGEILGILGLDLLGLLASGEPVTFSMRPGVAFDRAEIQVSSLASVNLTSQLRVHEMSRTAGRPAVSGVDADGEILICAGTSPTLTAVPAFASDEIRWYDTPVNGTPLHTGETYQPGPVYYQTTYYVEAVAAGCTEASVRTAVTLVVNREPIIQLNGSAVYHEMVGGTVDLPAAQAFNADQSPVSTASWSALDGAPLNGTTAGPFTQAGIYTYRFAAAGATCTSFIDVHVYVSDASGCEFVYNRVFANDGTTYTESSLLGFPIGLQVGRVEDPNLAADGDLSTFSVLDETVNPLAGLLTGRTSQTLRWNQHIPAGTPVTIKLAREFEAAAISGGIFIQAFRDNQPIGAEVLVDQHLVSALGGVNEFEYTFTPAEADVFESYNGIRVTLNSGIINLRQRVRIYGAYFHQPSSTLSDCTGGTVDIMTGYESIISGLNVASSLTAVNDPERAVDADPDSYATLNNAVGVNIKSKLDITFKQPTLAGDSVYLKIGIPSGLLNLTLLEQFSIQRYLGNQAVGGPIAFSNSLLKLTLLGGGSIGAVTFENDQAFDRIKILTGGVADALTALYIYDIKSIPVAKFPGLGYDPVADVHYLELCEGGSVILPPDGCSDIRFFDASIGGNEITSADIAAWTAGTTRTVYVQIERFGCVAGEERRAIELRVMQLDKPVLSPAGPIHVRSGGTMEIHVENAADYGTGVQFEWYKDGVLIAGETSETLEITGFNPADDSGEYTAIAVLGCKSEESDAVLVVAYDVIGWKSYSVSTGESYVSGGEEITYTIHVRNKSTAPINDVRITDAIPSNTTYVASSANAGGVFNNGVITWDGIDIPAGNTVTVSFSVRVDANLIGVSSISNVAHLYGDPTDPGRETFPPQDNDNPTEPDDSGDTGTDIPVVLMHQLDVEKVADDARVVAGEETSFTVTITNQGPSYLAVGKNIRIQERPGTGLVITGYEVVSGSATVTGTGNSATVTTAGVIAPSEAIVLRIHATVEADATGTITNGISVWNPDTPETDPPNDSDTDPIPVDLLTDLAIVKTVDNYQPYVGDEIEFTLTVENHGPSDARGVVVTDELPSGFTYVSSSATRGTYDPSTDLWTIGALASGETVTLTLVATVLSSGDYINYASVTGDEDDPDLNNNEDTPDDVVVPIDDSESRLVIVKNNALANDIDQNQLEAIILDSRGDGVSGEVVTFTVKRPDNTTFTETITTNSNGVARLNLTSAVPGNYEVAATAPGRTITNSPRTVRFIVGPPDHAKSELVVVKNNAKADGVDENILEARIVDAAGHAIGGQEVEFLITDVHHVTTSRFVTTDANGIAELILTSNYPGDVTVAAEVGGTAIHNSPQTVAFVLAADLSITKTADESEVVAGSNTSFTITLKNNSTVSIPAGEQIRLSERPGTGLEITGFSIISGPATITSSGNQATVTTTGNLLTGREIVVRVEAAVAASASGSISNGISVWNPGSNPDDDPDDEDDIPPVPVVTKSDLAITKSVNNYTPFVGDDITFTLTVTNHGPSDASQVVVTDELPSGFTYRSSTATRGTYDAATDRWSIGELSNGETVTLQIVVSVLSSGDYINYGSVTGENDDPDPTNNEDTPDKPVVPKDLSGSRLEIVKNNALADGVDENRLEATIVDNRGDGVEGEVITFTITRPDSAPETQTITTDANGKALLRLTSTVAGQVTVAASAPGRTLAGSPRTVTFVQTPVSDRTDLSIEKTVDNYEPFIGDNVVFTLKVTNHGPSDASGVWVSDKLPSGYEYVSSQAASGTYTPGTGRWQIGALENGQSLTLTITAKVLPTGDYINHGSVSGEEDDPDPSNNEDTPDRPVVPKTPVDNSAKLHVSKVADESVVLVGTTTTFTITVTNQGPGPLPAGAQVRLEERPGTGVEILSYAVDSGNGTINGAGNNAVLTTSAEIAPGGNARIKVVARISANAGTTITNGIAVRGPDNGPGDDPDDEDETDPVPVDRELLIPNLFTPNGDGINDRFVIRGLQQFSQRELTVLNRWGNQVYHNANYNNDWDGSNLPEGTYFYILKVRNNGSWTTYRGPVAIVRYPAGR